MPFVWEYILFDYANELCDNLEVATSYRKSEGQCGKTSGKMECLIILYERIQILYI